MDKKRDAVVVMVDESDQEAALPGFRFHPTDEELVGFYLRRKVESKALSIDIIKQVDIYKYDPWDLPRVSNLGDKEWYFFCLRGRKYRNSIRPNRVTRSGFWKATGIDRPIYAVGQTKGCIGLKKSLVYYRGSAGKGTKTDWMMHEFRLPSAGAGAGANSCVQEGETWTICRVFKRNISYRRSSSCAQAQSWKDTSDKHVTTDSASQTCSAEESNSPDDYTRLLASAFQVQQHSDNNSVTTYCGDKVQLYADQWNSPAQAPSAASHSNFPSSNANDFFFKDGSWDELGRIIEFSVDPFLLNDCRY